MFVSFFEIVIVVIAVRGKCEWRVGINSIQNLSSNIKNVFQVSTLASLLVVIVKYVIFSVLYLPFRFNFELGS